MNARTHAGGRSRDRGNLIFALVLSLALNVGIVAWAGARLDRKPPEITRIELDLRLLAPPPEQPPQEARPEQDVPPAPETKTPAPEARPPVKKPPPRTPQPRRPEPEKETPPTPSENAPSENGEEASLPQEIASASLPDSDDSAAPQASEPAPALAPARLSPDYQRLVQQKIERAKRYPRQSQIAHEEGLVKVRFVISASGQVSDVRVVGRSGYHLLDRAAMEAVNRAAPFPPLPEEFGDSKDITVPILFRIP